MNTYNEYIMTISISDTLGIVSLIFSIVALIVTIIGFFASLKFYSDGVNLNQSATRALTKIEEKTNMIGQQMTGMFDKTLNAAINVNRGGQITQDFEDTAEQIEKASKALLEKISTDLKNIGVAEKQKLTKFVTEQFKTISDQVAVTQENATDIVTSSDNEFILISQFQAKILESIRNSTKQLTISEISKDVNFSASVVEKAVTRLLAKRLVTLDNGKYGINEQKEKTDLSLIDKAFQNACNGKKQVYLANLGVQIYKLNPTFDVRAYGHESLSDYLRSQQGYRLIDNFINGLNHPIIEKI